MKSNILITGAAGFIGYHLCKSLLNDEFNIIGIDNLNNYYDIELKRSRLDKLKTYNKFTFHEVDICDKNSLNHIFIDYKPFKVINLAAQAGVRYSIENPSAYVETNLVGFTNILEQCRIHKVQGLIYASSSSVYGDNKKIPFDTNDRTDNPVSMYSVTKITNELMALTYSKLFNLNSIGLRFFTVYGPWGRPDMAYFIFTKKIINNEPIEVFNNGKMKRDFTYIDDIIHGIRQSIEKNYTCEIFNLGNNNSISLMNFINVIESEVGIKAKIDFKPMQAGDVKETYAEITKSKRMLNFAPNTKIEDGINRFVNWYKNYYNH